MQWPEDGEVKGYPLQYSGLENSMDCRVSGVGKSQTRLSDFTFTFHFHALEEEMENPRDRGAWWAAVYGAAHTNIYEVVAMCWIWF